jgi:glycosyltransferase involved in cell wall biosynthesis
MKVGPLPVGRDGAIFAVGFPRCNEPREIVDETIESIARSTLKPALIVIVDNGEIAFDVLDDIPPGLGNIDIELVRPQANLGCAGGWNRAVEIAQNDGIDHVVLLNADCAVSPVTFEKMFADPAPSMVCAHAFGCFRWDPEIRQKVGLFDDKFHPAYFEDADYRYRMKLAGVPRADWEFHEVARPSFGRAIYSTGIRHGWRHEDGRGYQGWSDEKLAWFYERLEANRRRYVMKWGGMPNFEIYTEPFNGRREE